jgi:molecular chaperone DnaK
MVRDAESHAAEDKKRKELVEAKNHADSLVHQTEKSLAEFGDKVSAEDKGAIETALSDLKAVKDGEDAEAITAKTQTLMQASMKLGEAMYKAQQASAEAGGAEGAAQPGADDGVVDAEFEEVKNDGKAA